MTVIDRARSVRSDVPDDLVEWIRELQQDPRFCAYCFTRVREHAAGHDAHEARALSVGPTVETFHAQGHRLDADGTETPAARTYDPVPEARLERTPDGDRVLFCPNCDREAGAGTEPGKHRDTGTLVDHLENLLDALGAAGDRRDEATQALLEAASDEDLAGHDRRVLATGLVAVSDNVCE